MRSLRSPSSLLVLRQRLGAAITRATLHFDTTTPCIVRPAYYRIRNGRVAASCYSASTFSAPRERFRAAVVEARRDNPILLPVLAIAAFGACSLFALLAYDEYTRVAPQFSEYPTPVEQRLRMALHYTYVSPDPDLAMANFADAVQAVEDCRMNPFSKAAMGVRLRFAEALEKFGRMEAAIKVMEAIVNECEERLMEVNRESLSAVGNALPTDAESQSSDSQAALRSGLVRVIIQSRVKIASLYSGDYLQNSKMAKTTLSEAVRLLVTESRDPQTNGLTEDNTGKFSLTEIAAILSQMGDLYATTGEEANAVQTYMLAIDPLRKSCQGTRSCKEVQIFSNIASTMDIAMKKPGATINGKPATRELLVAARKGAIAWADQAIATVEKVASENRDDICEMGLLSAQITKADLLLEGGDPAISSKIFTDLLPVLRERGLHSLLRVAEEGLKRAKS